MEDEVKEQDEGDEGEWVAADWVQVENADAHIADIPCHIQPGCHAMSKYARNAGPK
ncbi:MAG: hypothetical protein IBX41_02835 [Methanophagales archaeon]|nr:hypothetical protein [Methanophagales archaeon]